MSEGVTVMDDPLPSGKAVSMLKPSGVDVDRTAVPSSEAGYPPLPVGAGYPPLPEGAAVPGVLVREVAVRVGVRERDWVGVKMMTVGRRVGVGSGRKVAVRVGVREGTVLGVKVLEGVGVGVMVATLGMLASVSE